MWRLLIRCPKKSTSPILLLLAWASAAGCREGPWPLWIFIHGTDIVNRGLIVLFFVFFSIFRSFFRLPPLPPWKRLNSAIFRFFFCYPPLAPTPGNFSADALDYLAQILHFGEKTPVLKILWNPKLTPGKWILTFNVKWLESRKKIAQNCISLKLLNSDWIMTHSKQNVWFLSNAAFTHAGLTTRYRTESL